MNYKVELKEILLDLFHIGTSVDAAVDLVLELNDAYADKYHDKEVKTK